MLQHTQMGERKKKTIKQESYTQQNSFQNEDEISITGEHKLKMCC